MPAIKVYCEYCGSFFPKGRGSQHAEACRTLDELASAFARLEAMEEDLASVRRAIAVRDALLDTLPCASD